MSVSNAHPTRIAWTARQREVLELITRGHTNAQIAEALGISLDGAKWHVSEIITRLGVDSRDEAAEYWRAENGLRLRFTRAMRTMWPSAMWVRVAAGVAALAVGVGVAAAIFVVASDNKSEQASPSPSAAVAQPSATGPASPTTVAATAQTSPAPNQAESVPGVATQKWSVAAAVDIPTNIAFYVLKGCWSCDGPTSALERVYVRPDGLTSTETLFTPTGGSDRYIEGIGIARDASEMWASVCSRGYCGGLGTPSADAQTTLYRSTDGGVSWALFKTIDGPGNVVGDRDAWYLSQNSFDSSSGQWQFRYSTFPAGSAVAQPTDTVFASFDASLGLVWEKTDRLTWVKPDGTRAWSDDLATKLSGRFDPAYGFSYVTSLSTGGRLFSWVQSGSATTAYGVVENGELTEIFQPSLPGESLSLAAGDGPRSAYGNVFLAPGDMPAAPIAATLSNTSVPAHIDLANGVVVPVKLYGDYFGQPYFGRNLIATVIAGPFARVTTGTDCLNIRESANTSATSLGCFKDGVLLRIRDGASESAGWLAVNTPDGRPGYASAEFLQR